MVLFGRGSSNERLEAFHLQEAFWLHDMRGREARIIRSSGAD